MLLLQGDVVVIQLLVRHRDVPSGPGPSNCRLSGGDVLGVVLAHPHAEAGYLNGLLSGLLREGVREVPSLRYSWLSGA